ncbi:CaiB/BaiF CoA transferase family protein [Agrococcus sp. TSP3-2-1]|uniref:CaiB/BaiF CoA transferase family protein n=1 Tax=Agrococcus sp. TSP3-2-1 TaxID=2804583 RepID=UPI003CEFE309
MRPLDGITVVSIEQAVAAPLATRHLSDLGARVMKVERPSGDFARQYDGSVMGQSSYFVWLNRNKESVVLDLKEPQDRAVLQSMVRDADVFVQNLAPGAVERLGFGYEAVERLNARIVYLSISGYGTVGPYKDKKAYDLLAACEAGLLSITGSASEPARVGISVADIATGMYAYSGILAALIQRGRTGRGDHLHVSLLDALGEWMAQPYLYSHYSGRPIERAGASHVTLAPYGPAATSDGTVFFSVQNQGEWERFCETVLRDRALTAHPDFATNDRRVQHRALLQARIEAVLGDLSTVDAIDRLEQAGIANAILRSMAEFAAHPQLEARDRWQQVQTEQGDVRVLKSPVEARSFEYRYDPVPWLGQHSEAIRDEFLRRRPRRPGGSVDGVAAVGD